MINLPGVAQVKTALVIVTSVVLLAGSCYGGYRLYHYSQELKADAVTIKALTDNVTTLKANQAVLLSTNQANDLVISQLRTDSAAAKAAIKSLAAVNLKSTTALAAAEAKAKAAKGTTNDGPVAPVLRDAIRTIQGT